MTYAPLTAFFKKLSDTPFEVIRLHFDDNSHIDVIFEHLFFDLTLRKFVQVNKDNFDFVGHSFAKINPEGKISPVNVTDVTIHHDVFEAFSPHPKGLLNFFANGLLSATGGTLALCNMFDFDTNNMTYNPENKIQDLMTFGYLNYDALCEVVSENFFRDNHLDVLSVALGKRLISLEPFKAYLNNFKHCFLL